MRRFTRPETLAYERSNAILDPGIRCTSEMVLQACLIEEALASEDRDRVRDACHEMLVLLADASGIDRPTFRLKDTAYAKFRRGRAVWKLYGTCDPDGTITVAYKTAVRRKVFAFRTFFDTLVHEFMHHFDARKLRLARSFHTKGFYLRVRGLRDALLPQPKNSESRIQNPEEECGRKNPEDGKKRAPAYARRAGAGPFPLALLRFWILSFWIPVLGAGF